MSYILPKGKYRGETAEDVVDKHHDKGYLEWVLNNWELSASEHHAIKEAMNPSRELFQPTVGTKYITDEQVGKTADFIIRKIEAILENDSMEQKELAQRSVKEMYRMLTGKDYAQ